MGLLLLTVVLGCGLLDGDEASSTAETVAPVAANPNSAAEEAIQGGKYREAVGQLQKRVAEAPEDDKAWDLLELSMRRTGTPGEWVDSLSADQALGGRAEKHHVLRGTLALLAGRPADAVIAARAAASAAAADSAVLYYRAIAAGIAAPPDAPAVALALNEALNPTVAPAPMAPGRKPEKVATDVEKSPGAEVAPPTPPALPAEVEALAGWRAAELRAELKLAANDRAGATAEADKMAPGGRVAGHLAALIRLKAADGVTAAQPVLEAALKAAGEGDPGGLVPLLEGAAPVWLKAWEGPAFYEIVKNQRKAAKNETVGVLAAMEAEQALRAGKPALTLVAATVLAEVDKSEAGKAEAAWWRGLGSAALGNAAGTASAAADATGAAKAALLVLSGAMNGEPATLPVAGLPPSRVAVHTALVHQFQPHPEALAAAVDAAKQSGAVVTDLELLVRVSGREPITVTETDSAPLRSEAAVRSWLKDRAATTTPTGDHPATAGWTALISGTPAAAGVGVDAWARARTAVAAGDAPLAAREYGTLALAEPAWRAGPWRSLLVLNAPNLDEVDGDFSNFAPGFDSVTVMTNVHGWAHRRATAERRWRYGIAPLAPATKPEVSQALWEAVAARRYAELRWASGHGAWPAEAQTALTKAEAEAGLRAFQSPSLTTFREALSGQAVFSFRERPSGLELLLITEAGGRVTQVPADRLGQVRSYFAGVQSGKVDIRIGDRVRQWLLDGSNDLLLGIGRYVLVGDGELGLMPLTALPEQEDGLRFLIAVRFIGFEPTFDAFLPVQKDAFAEFKTDMYAICADQPEAQGILATFPNARVVVGETASVESWRAEAGTARFIHIGNLPSSPDGAGFKLANGTSLTLAEIAATRIHAEVVFVGAPSPDVAYSRIAALQHAGAVNLVGSAWTNTREVQEAFLASFWDTVSGRVATSRAISEARAHAVGVKDVSTTPPPGWASFFMMGGR